MVALTARPATALRAALPATVVVDTVRPATAVGVAGVVHPATAAAVAAGTRRVAEVEAIPVVVAVAVAVVPQVATTNLRGEVWQTMLLRKV